MHRFFLTRSIGPRELMTISKLGFCWFAAFCWMMLTSLAPAQTYTDLFNLTQSTGSAPQTPNLLAQGQDGLLYSTMPSSFPGDGTSVVASPAGGSVTATHYFAGTDG